jgi:DNA invertase Pin-like site-specific DNA recombinase
VSKVQGRSGESFISPQVQRDQIAAYARAHGHEILTWHEDFDQSGGKLDRPGLNALLARIDRGETQGIAVAYLDRLSRAGVADALTLVERILAGGNIVVSVDLGLDPTTATGEHVMTNMLALARMQRRRIAEAWDESNARAIARGVHFTRTPPFGYQRKKDGRLEPHPERAPLVGEVFQRRGDGQSWSQLADFLNARSRTTTGSAWVARTVAHLIRNRAYLGEAFHGRHRREDAHQPLVTLAEFEAANAVRGGKGAIRRESPLLAGLVRCAGCMYAMKGDMARVRDGERARMYRCRGRHAGGECPAPASIMAHVLDPFVVGYFLTWAGDSTAIDDPDEGGKLAEAERRLEDAQARLDAYMADDELAEASGREAHLRGARTRRAALEAANAECVRLRAEQRADERRVYVLRDEFPAYARDEQRHYLTYGLDAVYVKRGRGSIEDRAVIFWKGEGPTRLPQRGVKAWTVRSLPWPESPTLASIPRWAWRRGHPELPEDLRADWQRTMAAATESMQLAA